MWNALWKSPLFRVALAVVIVGLAVGYFVPGRWLWWWYLAVSAAFWDRVCVTVRKRWEARVHPDRLTGYARALLRLGCIALWLLMPGLLIDYAGPVRRLFGNMTMEESFYATVADCDRIAIRNGGYTCCSRVGKDILVEITDPDEVKAFIEAIKFTSPSWLSCKCCGYPGIDFYCDDERLALTAVKHGETMRWQGFGMAEVYLADDTRQFLAEFFRRHDIGDSPRIRFEEE